MDQEIKINHDQFGDIDLASIARKESGSDLINLMEIVMFTVLNSPQKETFIHPIMQLDEKCQTQLMFFIQKVLGNDAPYNSPQLYEPEHQEVHVLRHEKKRLTYKLQVMQEELSNLASQKTEIASERDELKQLNDGLTHEFIRKSPSLLSPNITFVELESKIYEKEDKLTIMQEELSDTKRNYENEIARLRDELDITHATIIRLQQAEKSLHQYKKKCENMTNVSKKLSEVTKQNEYLKEKINSQEDEIKDLVKTAKTANHYKEQFNHEKEKAESLAFALDNKDKHIKQISKQIYELEENLRFAQNKVQEFENDRKIECGSNISDDSFTFHRGLSGLGNEIEEIIKQDSNRKDYESRRNSRKTSNPVNTEQVDTIVREKTYYQEKCEKYKNRSKANQENLGMLQEELNLHRIIMQKQINDCEERLEAYRYQINSLTESLTNNQTDKVKYEQLHYEYDKLKNSKESFLQEIKKLHEEKDLMYKRFIECREETIVLQNVANEKEIKIREKTLNEKLWKDKINELQEKEVVSIEVIENLKKQKQEVNEDYHIKFIELEKELITVKSEKAALILRLTDKDQRIIEILKDKADTIKILEEEHHEVLDRIKYENDRKINLMINQTEEALVELQNEREQLAAKLKCLRSNSTSEYKLSNTIKEIKAYQEEISRLREYVNEKEKENSLLIKTNKEIKQCWKESAKLLKQVWKELGIETQKLETATQRRRMGLSILQ